ncbi:hypothetical protein F0562_001492 [Nyssa sinensis]|uniref:Chitin-binding type-1 domain-containing protein n=1 Tax=Nyssa sinensis TaxID=561372 RepID=A0A5J5C3D6_9ASTE|nr:hypothetical protein F0562_001492 [Nyssa sinensis]
MRCFGFPIFSLLAWFAVASAEQCGRQSGGALCPGGLCCSQFGWCGSTPDYCGVACQSQCSDTATPGPGPGPGPIGGDITNLITRSMFYTYDAFIAAARSFPGFATTGVDTTRKREIQLSWAKPPMKLPLLENGR